MKESLTELRHIEKELDHEDEEFSMILERILENSEFEEISQRSGKTIAREILNSGKFGKTINQSVNVIPPINNNGLRKCCRTLLVAIGGSDSINTRILEALRHCAITCKNKTRQIHIVTSKWDVSTWKKFSGDFRDMGIPVYLYVLDIPRRTRL